jgi:hypothetical protein
MIDSQLSRIEYLQRLNYNILDSLRNQLDWLFDFCERHNIKIPLSDLQKLMALSKVAGSVLNNSSTESQQRNKTPDDSTEQIFEVAGIFCLRVRRRVPATKNL